MLIMKESVEDDYTLEITLQDPGERTKTFNPSDYESNQEVKDFIIASKTFYKITSDLVFLWNHIFKEIENDLREIENDLDESEMQMNWLGSLKYDHDQILKLVDSAWNSYKKLHLLKDNPIPKHPDDLIPKRFDDSTISIIQTKS